MGSVRNSPYRPLDLTAMGVGMLTTFAISGYRFGEGNHTIYLLDAIRRNDPTLLTNDWFVTHTLQYHSIFSIVAAQLMRWGIIQPTFAAGYALLIVALHVAWRGIVGQLGGSTGSYLVSVLLYYLSAGGTGLGMYQFLQDSSVLPSNIANVALLWAFFLWMRGSPVASGACFGAAGLFHLNFAVVGCVIWIALLVLSRSLSRQVIVASLLALAPSAVNVAIAASGIQPGTSIPLADFVDLYVRLRHPHHYDPSTWPVWLLMAFLWPLPVAILALHQLRDAPAVRARQIFLVLLMIQLAGIVSAGFFYMSQTAVQLSLYRFSIFVQLLACISVANWAIAKIGATWPGWVASAGCLMLAGLSFVRGPFLGLFDMPTDNAAYLEVCRWARQHTDRNSIFLVPPGESGFRLNAQRAIVVNFKAVPQLGRELPEWARRVQAVTGVAELRQLPRGYARTLNELDRLYRERSAEELVRTAREFGAEYIVVERIVDGMSPAFQSAGGRYFVYRVQPR